MKQRSPAVVILLTIVTLGIYALVWYVMTKEELNARGANIPTAWILIIPFIGGPLFIWKYASGVETVTKQSAPVTFLMLFLLGFIGMAIVQSNYNKIS